MRSRARCIATPTKDPLRHSHEPRIPATPVRRVIRIPVDRGPDRAWALTGLPANRPARLSTSCYGFCVLRGGRCVRWGA